MTTLTLAIRAAQIGGNKRRTALRITHGILFENAIGMRFIHLSKKYGDATGTLVGGIDYAPHVLAIETQQKIDHQWIGSATTFAHQHPVVIEKNGVEMAAVPVAALNKVVKNKVIFDTLFKYLTEHVPTSPIPLHKESVWDTKSYLSQRFNANNTTLNQYFTTLLTSHSLPVESASQKYISHRLSESDHDGSIQHINNTSKPTDIDPSHFVPHVDTHLNHLLNIDSPASSGGRLLSKLFTFPLSLSLGLRKLAEKQAFPVHADGKVNMLMAGARSECTLPRFLWKEVLISLGDLSSSRDSSSSEDSSGELCVTFIGPGLPAVNLITREQAAPILSHSVEWAPTDGKRALLSKISFAPLLSQYQCPLHLFKDPESSPSVPNPNPNPASIQSTAINGEESIWQYMPQSVSMTVTEGARRLINQQDVMCMFNPGIGYSFEMQQQQQQQNSSTTGNTHSDNTTTPTTTTTSTSSSGGSGSSGSGSVIDPHLTRNMWFPSLVLTLLSRKPIVCTAHGLVDYARDVKYWHLAVDAINAANIANKYKQQQELQQSTPANVVPDSATSSLPPQYKLHFIYNSHDETQETRNNGSADTSDVVSNSNSNSNSTNNNNCNNMLHPAQHKLHNPYGSHKWDVDKLDPSQPVLRPNSLLYIIQLVEVTD